MSVLILIPAAGAASRMRGGDKLMEPVGGIPQLRRIALAALATGQGVLLTLPANRPERAAALAGLACQTLILPDASEGMALSLREGANRANGRALMVLPADMPEIDTQDLLAMLGAHQPGHILRATDSTATPGHPVIFPAHLVPALTTLRGDRGAAAVLGANSALLQTLALPGSHATTDLDTPEDWANWRAGQLGFGKQQH